MRRRCIFLRAEKAFRLPNVRKRLFVCPLIRIAGLFRRLGSFAYNIIWIMLQAVRAMLSGLIEQTGAYAQRLKNKNNQ